MNFAITPYPRHMPHFALQHSGLHTEPEPKLVLILIEKLLIFHANISTINDDSYEAYKPFTHTTV